MRIGACPWHSAHGTMGVVFPSVTSPFSALKTQLSAGEPGQSSVVATGA